MKRTTQLELTEIYKKDKAIQLSSIEPSIKKNVLRLLNRENMFVDPQFQNVNEYFWLYFNPLSTFVLVWNSVFILIFYIVQLQISLSLAFGPLFFHDELSFGSTYLPIYISLVLYFCIDIGMNFFKGYYAFGRGKVIDDINMIISHYLKTQFYFDVIFVVIYIIPLIYQAYGVNFLQLISGALIWIKKFKYQQQIIAFLQYQPTLRVVFMLVILFIDVLMIGNYGACIFIGMDHLLYNSQYYGSNTAYYWLTNNTSYPLSLITGPWYYQYIYGQQFSTGTLSTLAPGPFAKNPWEAFYAIVVMILFMVLASYVGQVLIQIVYTYTERRIFHEENIISFDNFMQLKSVDRSIRNRIYNFFQLIWQVELKMESKQQDAMIDKLPNYLKQELLLEIGFTRSIYFLQFLPHQAALEKMISLKLQRVTIDSDTCIFQNQNGNNITAKSLFFIKEGMAKYYVSQSKKVDQTEIDVIKRVGKEKILNLSNIDRMLGLYEFITGQDYQICCKSIDLCLIQKLSLQNFMDIIQQLNIWEQFKELQHKVLIQRDLKIINKTCVLCLQSHVQSDCPEIYFNKSIKQMLLDNESLAKDQSRKTISRKNTKSYKLIPKDNAIKQAQFSVFNLFKNINLGKLIVDINKLEGNEPLEIIQEVKIYSNYYKQYNIIF